MEERPVSFNFQSSHGFAGKKAQATDEANPPETSTDKDDDFEFIHISGDYNEGQIRPVFPLFNRDLLTPNDSDQSDHGKKLPELSLRLPLDKSFVFESDDKERDPPSSPSSESEADELRSVPADDYYCSRKPEAVEESPRTYKKSDSVGALASKQWKLSDFLHRRSSSEGMEDSFGFYSPKDRGLEAEIRETIEIQKDRKTNATKMSLVSAHEMFYARKQGEKRKSYAPYRQDLAGFFINVNAYGYGKAFSRFKNIGGHAPLPDGLPSPKPCP